MSTLIAVADVLRLCASSQGVRMTPEPRPAAIVTPTILRVPYHIDEYLPGLDLPLPAEQTITPRLTSRDVWGRLAELYTTVAEAVTAAVRNGTRPVVVSGDCTTALGTVSGLQHADIDPGIVWIDAHGDLQTLETTASGYLGGLPLRLLAGYRPELIADKLGLRPVPGHRIVLAGPRDLDPPEAEYLASAPIRQTNLEQLGASLPVGALYAHVDADITDPAQLPGLRFPAPGGPSLAGVTGVLRELLRTGRVAALGIACTWHPGHRAGIRFGPYLQAALDR
jgi:arginase